MNRCCGVLLPVFSIPSPYGIGTMGKAAYNWIDFLHQAGQQLWQVLPIGPTSYGDSPYQSFSAFAGNPYFIDLEMLCEIGLLKRDECVSLNGLGYDIVIDYEKQYRFVTTFYEKRLGVFTTINGSKTFAQNTSGQKTTLCSWQSKTSKWGHHGHNGRCRYEHAMGKRLQKREKNYTKKSIITSSFK